MKKYEGFEKYLFTDTYNYFLKYQNMKLNDWNKTDVLSNLERDCNSLVFKYKDNPYASMIVKCTFEQLFNYIVYGCEAATTREQWEEKLEITKNSKPFDPIVRYKY